mgnify:CR=1 FL=1
MWEILEVLDRHHRGDSQREIERTTGKSRKTIRRYIKAAKKLGWEVKKKPTEELAGLVLNRFKPGPKNQSSEAQDSLLPFQEEIKLWIEGGEDNQKLTISKIHALLKRRGLPVSYQTVYRFVRNNFDTGKRRITVRMPDTAPGEVAEVDFGRLGLVLDPETGKKRVTYALIVTLVYSRHQYVHITQGQKYKDFIDGLESAWEFFGGVVARLIIDNLKAAVFKADKYDPIFQRMFEEYAKYRGFIIDATVPRHAKGKPHVERSVPYVRDNFFKGEKWLNREHVQRKAVKWCLEVAGKRVHGTTRQHPLDVFMADEQAILIPLTKERFDPPRWAKCKVHPDHHIRLSHAYYSIPTKHIGKVVDVREDTKIVRVYSDGTLVKSHPRKRPGEKSTDTSDYPTELTAYTLKDTRKHVARAKQKGEDIGAFVAELLSGQFPWAKIRQAQMIFGLAKKFGNERVNSACKRALQFGRINSYAVKTIIEENLDNGSKGEQGHLFHVTPRFLRPRGTYSTFERNSNARD